jgi:hypothetical protein
MLVAGQRHRPTLGGNDRSTDLRQNSGADTCYARGVGYVLTDGRRAFGQTVLIAEDQTWPGVCATRLPAPVPAVWTACRTRGWDPRAAPRPCPPPRWQACADGGEALWLRPAGRCVTGFRWHQGGARRLMAGERDRPDRSNVLPVNTLDRCLTGGYACSHYGTHCRCRHPYSGSA